MAYLQTCMSMRYIGDDGLLEYGKIILSGAKETEQNAMIRRL